MYFPDICDINYTKSRPADINPETSCSIIDPDPGYSYIYVGYVGADFDTANIGPPPNCLVTATGRDGATAFITLQMEDMTCTRLLGDQVQLMVLTNGVYYNGQKIIGIGTTGLVPDPG
ncbi:hypothetical protein WR25_16336 [Diploscapter pachys]|uniref:Uncharacterized protein n=1 Tax=Diploscapter pachys TaxID=2018661 RepID=A0A2A2LR55_9BILA|nr:hypothetical protein WR25_16336 [Diploscapter pachys]